MFHGRKKEAFKAPTPEEVQATQEKLDKIVLINTTMLAKRNAKEYTQESLAQTEKFSVLSPDFNTLWNYRREIITHLFQSMDAKARLEMVKAELMMLSKGIKRSPKSYTLWYQRQWAIEIGLVEEAKLIEQNTWRSTILDMELGLCS